MLVQRWVGCLDKLCVSGLETICLVLIIFRSGIFCLVISDEERVISLVSGFLGANEEASLVPDHKSGSNRSL
jgi:hypothetical protein